MAYKDRFGVWKLLLSLGLILAIVFGLGAWLYLRQAQQFKPKPPQEIKSPPEVEAAKEDLSIAQPANETVLKDKKVKFIGSTFKKALVSIVNGEDSQIFEADDNGHFEKEMELSQGFNFFTVKAVVVSSDQEAVKNITLYFGKDDVYQKFYGGSVKGILGKNLTLEGPTGSRTVEISDSAEVETPQKLSRAEATKGALAQVKVGDFVIALGTPSSQDILKGEKIIILKSPPQKLKEAIFGTIAKIEEKEITLNLTKTRAKRVFKVDKKTSIIIKGGQKPAIESLVNGDFMGVIIAREEDEEIAQKMIVFPRPTQEATPSGT